MAYGLIHATTSITMDDDGLFCLRLTEADKVGAYHVDIPFSENDLKRLKRQMILLKRARKAAGSLTVGVAEMRRHNGSAR